MAKFARYELGKTDPLEIYEGGFMQCDGAYVKIFAGEESTGDAQLLNPPRLLRAIRLSGSQSIAEIGIPTNPEVPKVIPQAPPDIKPPQEPPSRSRKQKKSAQKVASLPKKSE
jgi:hypothetical protein